jgi:hypothetical protein
MHASNPERNPRDERGDPKSDCSRSPGKSTSSTPAAALAMAVKRTNHQYSDRLARPEICAYAPVVMFRFTDCVNSI